MTGQQGPHWGMGLENRRRQHRALPGDATFPAATATDSPGFKQVFEGEERQSPSHKCLIGN